MIDPFVSQVTATIILSIFPFSIFYQVLKILSALGIYNFEMSFTTSFTFILFGVMFLILLAVNQIYFFVYNNWEEIIIYFRKNEVTKRIKNFTILYIGFCVLICTIFLFFFGYKF
jgi:predicted nucleic acid-binding Zn ribbon protein